MATKDLTTIQTEELRERRDSDASDISLEYQLEPLGRRRNSLIEQIREFLSRSVDFTLKIDDPFEKEMY
ncbi:unnamed protein product [Caenorhabditis sp. 36 PRJEB53466]|nr:unnamed protein product [Caenorhabditis sp. 36 PRJEB53466]CAI2348678.1 unnamed protein product [Caenorhabditis sp. 36 PRJEB53466]